MPDVIDRLRNADPIAPGEAALDPDSPQARAMLLRARTLPAPQRRGSRVGGAVAAGLAATALAVVVLGGGSPTPVDARAVVATAAAKTAAFDSGRVTWSTIAGNGEYRVRATNVLRFDGDRFEIVSRADEVLPSGERRSHASTFRMLEGRGYSRDDTKPGAPFEDLGPGPDDAREGFAPAAPGDVTAREQAAIANHGLIDLVLAARDVKRTVDAEGRAVHRATIPADALAKVDAPGILPLPPGGAPDVTLELTLAADETIRQLVHETAAGYQRFEWAELGEPQAIEAP